ncbi:MAG: multiubiquitin domain-containing protein [Polyangiaceae bacterium]
MDEKKTNIVVNGTDDKVETEQIAYATVVTFAYPDYPQNPQVIYSVTYKGGPSQNPEGTLPLGGSVYVKNGMRFKVSPTGQS